MRRDRPARNKSAPERRSVLNQILHHDMSKDYFDSREQPVREVGPVTPESIAAALKARDAERAGLPFRPSFELPSEADWRRLEAYEAVRRLAGEVGGYRRLATLVRNLAAMAGEEV